MGGFKPPLILSAVVAGRDLNDYSYSLYGAQFSAGVREFRIIFFRELLRPRHEFYTSINGRCLVKGIPINTPRDVLWLLLVSAMRENGDNPDRFDLYCDDKIMRAGVPLLAGRDNA